MILCLVLRHLLERLSKLVCKATLVTVFECDLRSVNDSRDIGVLRYSEK